MTDPFITSRRWRMPRQASYTPSVDSGYLDLYLDDATGYPAVRNSSGTNTVISPDRAILFYGAPNDNGWWNIDVSAGEALNCKHLEILYFIRGASNAATSETLLLYYNTDTTATNYRYSYMVWNGSDADGSSAGSNAAVIGFTTSNGSPVDEYTHGRSYIPWFRDTNFVKHSIHEVNYITAANTVNQMVLVHRWTATTTAITSLKFRTSAGATNTFTRDSKIMVIGHRY